MTDEHLDNSGKSDMTHLELQSGRSFDELFRALTDYDPLKWQRRLFARLLSGVIPAVLDLPTGLGKTSVIPIWLIALAAQSLNDCPILPRRLIYIVNRRTVVDQATTIVSKMRDRIIEPDNPAWQNHGALLHQLRGNLVGLSAGLDPVPIAISTLRGELADNQEWKDDPARPAIIVGTIDMIGSKLLFSGYGDGRYLRAHHAGLIGQDALIIHDEAHLTPAFSELLSTIAKTQHHDRENRPVRILELSATSLGNECNVLSLQAQDESDGIVRQRLDAVKRLCFHEVDKDGVIAKIVELAGRHETIACKVLVYVRVPESAMKVAHALAKQFGSGSAARIRLLTGAMRGQERDRLVKENPVYRAFLQSNSKLSQTVYLISTSAGEVGVDLDADHQICDLTSLDSMIQRFGRVNRRAGEHRVALVDVVVQKEERNKKGKKDQPLDQAAKATLSILTRLPRNDDSSYNASPRNLRKLLTHLDQNEKAIAFAPRPPNLPLTDIMFDAWSLTSILKPMPGRPEVAPFLHGLETALPQTYIAWRKEVALLAAAHVQVEILADWFRSCRIVARELLRERTDRVKKTLEALLKCHRNIDQDLDFPVILLDERGNAQCRQLSEIVEKDDIAFRTVVLPVEAGGLRTDYGMLDGSAIDSRDTETDVADSPSDEDPSSRRERWLVSRSEKGERWERLMTGEIFAHPPPALSEKETVTLQELPEDAEVEGELRQLTLMTGSKAAESINPETNRIRQTLDQHTEIITHCMERIARTLQLDPVLQEALTAATRRHDLGKDRPVWQRFACNPAPASSPLAKSPKYLHGRALGGYRHEYGSMMDAALDDIVKNHPERDLILHLIASHHGWARPHFEGAASDNTYRTEENERAAVEAMRRFGQLQQRFGRWGLAWLEALLRCADIAASKGSAETSLSTHAREFRP